MATFQRPPRKAVPLWHYAAVLVLVLALLWIGTHRTADSTIPPSPTAAKRYLRSIFILG